MLKKIIAVVILIQAIILAYFLIFQQYFQQDEWHGFGIIISQGTGYITLNKSIPELLLGDRVGARLLTFGLFNIFHLNPIPYGIFATIVQLLNICLVFLLAKKLTKHLTIAMLASLLFLINELGNEAYAWFGTMTGSLTATSFFLLSLLFFIKFIDTRKYKFTILSAVLLWFSFLFKEIGAFAFIFYPILFVVRSQKRNLKLLFKSHLPLIVLGIIMLTYFAKTVLFIPGDRANYVNTGGSFIPSLVIHAIQYPMEGTVQAAVPNEFLFKLSSKLTRIIKPNLTSDSLDYLVESQSSVAEITIIILIIIAATFSMLLRKHIKNIPLELRKTLLISILFTSLSFLPYIVINRSFSYLDSRYYYLGTVGISIFIAVMIVHIFQKGRNAMRLIALSGIIFYVFMHESTLLSDFKLMAGRSHERQSFLKQVNEIVPALQKKTVFFITGDSEGYYGLSELKTPFQSGLGHVLMVKYTVEKKLSSSFFNEETMNKLYDVGFLYDILGQGYREIDGQGFGYYFDKNQMQKDIDKKLFTKNDIISLYYESENKKLKHQNLAF